MVVRLLEKWLFYSELWKLKQSKAAVVAALGFLIFLFLTVPDANAALVSTSGANKLCDLQPIIENIIRISVRLAGMALFIMLVIGGFLYLTSGGEPQSLEQAKKTISHAILGIALLAGAWLALSFIKAFTGVNVTSFIIPCEE